MMISPPYWNCPACGRQAFGVFGVNNNHYFRHCCECDEARLLDLPPLDKKIIYLDQFVWSRMKKAIERISRGETLPTDDVFYHDLFLRLDRLTKRMLVVCPFSPAHRLESLGLVQISADGTMTLDHVDSFRRMCRLMGHLSCGLNFRHGHSILRKQVISALQQWLHNEPTSFTRQNDDALSGNLNAWLPLFHGGIDSVVSVHDIQALERSSQTFERNIAIVVDRWRSNRALRYADWHAQELVGHARMLREAYNRREPQITWLRDRFGPRMGTSDPLADIVLIVLDEIREQEGLDLQSAQRRADEFFGSLAFATLPNVRVASALWAGLAHRLVHGGWEKLEASISHDVDFVSSYLTYCDIFFVENQCAEVLTQNPARGHVPEGNKVYSLRTKAEFIAALEQIEHIAPPSIISASADVYGIDLPDLTAFF